MSGKATTTSLISVVLVTDASLTVAGEWHRILNDCVGSITHRLSTEIHPNSEVRDLVCLVDVANTRLR